MTEHAPLRTERVDFRATSDPRCRSPPTAARRNLLSYRELYELWERQQWASQDLDFTQDRIDWHERIDAEERFAAHVRAVARSSSASSAWPPSSGR